MANRSQEITLVMRQMEAKAGRLMVSAEVVNRSGEEVLLFDALHEGAGASIPPALVYTVIEGRVLHLVKAVLKIPYGVQVEIPDVPYARLLKAEETRAILIDLPLPVPYHNPYDLDVEDSIVECSQIGLSVGYAIRSALRGPLETSTVNGTVYITVPYQAAVAAQRIVDSPLSRLAVSVHKKP